LNLILFFSFIFFSVFLFKLNFFFLSFLFCVFSAAGILIHAVTSVRAQT